jgi:hypothetical protein
MEHENKLALWIELEKLRSCGVTLSIPCGTDYTKVPLWKLRHEYEQHEAQQVLLQRVGHAKVGIKLFTFVVQGLTSSFLKLDGWSQHVQDQLDSGLHDSALEHIYRSVFGKSRPNPWISIIILVFGTMGLYHLDNWAKEAGTNPVAGPNRIASMLNTVAGFFSAATAPRPTSMYMRPTQHQAPPQGTALDGAAPQYESSVATASGAVPAAVPYAGAGAGASAAAAAGGSGGYGSLPPMVQGGGQTPSQTGAKRRIRRPD